MTSNFTTSCFRELSFSFQLSFQIVMSGRVLWRGTNSSVIESALSVGATGSDVGNQTASRLEPPLSQWLKKKENHSPGGALSTLSISLKTIFCHWKLLCRIFCINYEEKAASKQIQIGTIMFHLNELMNKQLICYYITFLI